MKKTPLYLFLFLLFGTGSIAQTKVFKEVSEEISSQVRPIVQDNALVGYVVFTQLEKASADSFNYRITIMDENLNDIGKINFREQKLVLADASFEQDVLCLAYFKSNVVGVTFSGRKEYRSVLQRAKNAVLTQFLSLDGTIIRSNSIPVDIEVEKSKAVSQFRSSTVGSGNLKQGIQLSNISGKGFACFFGDDRQENLVAYNTKGEKIWEKPVREKALRYVLLTAGDEIYLLAKKKDKMDEGGYEIFGYTVNSSKDGLKHKLVDKNGNSLKVLAFDNDPATGKPYLTGNIISRSRGNRYEQVSKLAKGTYLGVFSINIAGIRKDDLRETYSYWSDGSQSFLTKKGYNPETRTYSQYSGAFKDYEGNTYFTGSSFTKKPRWGGIIAATLTAPLILPPVLLLGAGTQKSRITDAVILKQNAKGTLTVEKNIAANNTASFPSRAPYYMVDQRSFYSLVNSDTKTSYVVINDVKDIFIYNVNQKKIVRTIPHRDGNLYTYVYPAKEGHLMISEYNRKEKYTRYSIESL